MKEEKTASEREHIEVTPELLDCMPGSRIRVASEKLLEDVEQNAEIMTGMFEMFTEFEKDDERFEVVRSEVEQLTKAHKTITTAHKITESLLDELAGRDRDTRNSLSGTRLQRNIPTNGQIDVLERNLNHFARQTNFYKMFLIFFIGCFGGVVIETIYCLLQNGRFESRTALVYGPFNPVYGLGALMLSFALYKFRNRGRTVSFAGGFIVGSVIEYFCSFFQELFFGSTSWDYHHLPFNINGRVCLLYSVFWGILGIAWIKMIYPVIARGILKIPNSVGKQLVWVLLVFMVVNCTVSAAVTMRWSARVHGVAKDTPIGRLIDERYPDERMRQIYANLEFK